MNEPTSDAAAFSWRVFAGRFPEVRAILQMTPIDAANRSTIDLDGTLNFFQDRTGPSRLLRESETRSNKFRESSGLAS